MSNQWMLINEIFYEEISALNYVSSLIYVEIKK